MSNQETNGTFRVKYNPRLKIVQAWIEYGTQYEFRMWNFTETLGM